MFGWIKGSRKGGTAPEVDWSALDWAFDTSQTCACCGIAGGNLLSIAFDAPDPMGSSEPKLENAAFPGSDGDILTEDFARLGEHHFVRCVMEFPLQGRSEVFLVGVWGTLSPANFDAYVDKFDPRETDQLDTMFSWLCNMLPALSDRTTPVECRMECQPGAQRPKLYVEDQDHPYFAAQQTGLSPDDLRRWLASMGHTGPQRH